MCCSRTIQSSHFGSNIATYAAKRDKNHLGVSQGETPPLNIFDIHVISKKRDLLGLKMHLYNATSASLHTGMYMYND